MDRNTGSQVRFEVVAGPEAGLSALFDGPATVVVGRSEDAQIRLANDRLISRRHFCLEIAPPQCVVRDLGSTNGTFVNGQRVEQQPLRDGDEVAGGESRIQVHIVSAAKSTESAEVFETQPMLSAAQPAMAVSRSDVPQPGAVPERIADYLLKGEIGRGAMGRVYGGQHIATRQPVAIKLLDTVASAEASLLQLFLREASLLTRLQHKRIVRAFDFGIYEQRPYLVMEYIPVLDCDQLLQGVSPGERTRIACWLICQVLEALQFAHDHHVVHRDVKPSNILVYRGRRHLHAKLSDFGLAKNYLSSGYSAVSSDSDVRGTLAYMPPEQLMNCRYSKPVCDIYAAGACLYRFLSGAPPHETYTASEAIHALLYRMPTPLGKRHPHLPPGLIAIVERAMARSPEDRFQNAASMRAALVPFTAKSSEISRS